MPQYGIGAGFPPAPGGLPAVVAGADPLESLFDRWMELSQCSWLLSHQLKPGSLFEVATYDTNGQVDGTAIVMLRMCYAPDAEGWFMEVAHCGASQPHQNVNFDAAASHRHPLGQSPSVLHWCPGGGHVCQVVNPSRHVFHVNWMKPRR